MTVGSSHPGIREIYDARHDGANEPAIALLNGLPTLTWRRIAATFMAVVWPPRLASDPEAIEARRRQDERNPPFASGLPTFKHGDAK
jgi:hypothetical protein